MNADQVTTLTHEQDDLRELRTRLSRVLAVIQDPLKATEGQVRGRQNYRYADLSDCLKAVRPLLSAEGLALIQPMRVDGEILTVSTQVCYGLAAETSELSAPAPKGMQELGSAVTYLRRYTLCALLAVQGDEADPDKEVKAGPAAEPRKDEIRAKAQERAATTQASTEAAPQPMTAEELRAQALRLQKWAAQRGIQIPATGVLKVLFDAKKWDIMSRKDVQEWGRTLDDVAFEPAILAFLRANFGPATQPEAVSYPPSNPAAVMKAITGWAKVQELANPESEENTKIALSTLLADLKMEYSSMTPEKWGEALAKINDPKQTAHWLGVLGDCYPPF